MPLNAVSRRRAIATLLAGAAATGLPLQPLRALGVVGDTLCLSDGTLTIEIDGAMQSRLLIDGKPLTAFDAPDSVRLVDTTSINRFTRLEHREDRIDGDHGPGTRHTLRAVAGDRIALDRTIDFLDRYPGLAILTTRYRNIDDKPLQISGWTVADHELSSHPFGAWSFAGASYADRRDWIQPVRPGFEQRNFMGMNASDYGGGTPVAVVWHRDAGLAVGHIETVPKLVSLPVSARAGGTAIGMAGEEEASLGAGEALTLPQTLLMVHRGDHFVPLDAYRRVMADRGLAAPEIPRSSYGPIWCAWGYERNYTPRQVAGTLPKAKSLGFEWAVLDDGWQARIGDWELDRTKYPRGDADMKAFVAQIKAAGMRPRLWLAPLAAVADSALLRDHGDMLLLDAEGKPQEISWWNALTLCPAYPPTIDYFRDVVRRIIGDWGYAGLKLDGQHLNGVAPCHNPAHNHARPEESFEKLQDFWKAIYAEAQVNDPEAVVEICPCGDSFAFHNIQAMNNTPASDPLSSWQVRLKGKTFKALMGGSAPFSGDHVELSDNHDDFASTYGVGGIPSTKFTWPRDTENPTDKLPPGGYVLTPAREVIWRDWIERYLANRLAEGSYRGELYDIAHDRPEAHAVETEDGRMHYAFFAGRWDGAIDLRGLGDGEYQLTDGVTGRSLGMLAAGDRRIRSRFDRFTLIQAAPMEKKA